MNWPSGPRPPPAQWLRTRSTWWPLPTTSTSPSSCRSFPTSQRYASASRSSLEICRIHNYTSSCKMSSKDRTEHFAIVKIEELLIKKILQIYTNYTLFMTHKLPSFFLLFYCSGEKMRNWFPLEHVRDDWKGDEYMNCWFWKVSLLQRKWAGCGQLSNRTQFMPKTNKAEHQGRHS